MSVRETLNKNTLITAAAVTVIICGALVAMASQLITTRGRHPHQGMVYFTIDDGQTYFTDTIQKLSPIEKDGQLAYRAQVFRCGRGSKPFVAYLERYTPEAKAKLEEMRTKGPVDAATQRKDLEAVADGVEVKRPGDKEWVKQSDYRKVQAIMTPTCPDGSTQNLYPVLP